MKPNAGKNMIQWGKEVIVLGRENDTLIGLCINKQVYPHNQMLFCVKEMSYTKNQTEENAYDNIQIYTLLENARLLETLKLSFLNGDLENND
jgi:hypothetical protein